MITLYRSKPWVTQEDTAGSSRGNMYNFIIIQYIFTSISWRQTTLYELTPAISPRCMPLVWLTAKSFSGCGHCSTCLCIPCNKCVASPWSICNHCLVSGNDYLQLSTCLYPTDTPYSYGILIAKLWQSPDKVLAKPWIIPEKPWGKSQPNKSNRQKWSVSDATYHRVIIYSTGFLNIYTPSQCQWNQPT